MLFKIRKPFFFIVLVLLMVTLSCGTSTGSDEGSLGSEVVTQVPIEDDIPTAEPIEAEAEVNIPSSPWYLEEFDSNLDNWSQIYLTQETDNVYKAETDVYLQDDGVWFDINIPDTYIYLFNENYTYDNVSIELEVENTGPHNSQYINLVCRYTPDKGWYEFSVAASGKVQLWRYDFKQGYILIEDGGSTAIKQGNETNTFKMVCDDDGLSLFINGDYWQKKAFVDNNYREGYVGFSAGTMNVYPIEVVFNWVKVTEP